MWLNSNNSSASPALEDTPTFVPSWISDVQALDYSAITKMYSESDPDLPFSNIDLFSLDGIPANEIRRKLFEYLDVKESKNGKEKAKEKLNNIYQESIDYLDRILLRKLPNGFKRKWESVDEFLSAIEKHTKRTSDGLYSLMFCAVLKVMVVEAWLYENPSIEELDKDMELLLQKMESIPWLKILKPKKWANEDYISYELGEIYKWKLESRPKSKDSIRTKLIYNRGYPALSKFRDLLAMRLELDPGGWHVGYVHTILSVRNWLYGKWAKVKFEIKWWILSAEDIGLLQNNNIEVVVKASKDSSSLSYEDAKFTGWKVKVKSWNTTKALIPEIQFVLPNNKNESWFSNHKIYDLKKVLSANARLFGWLTVWNIAYILKEYKTGFDPRLLLSHLLYPQDDTKKPFLYLLRRKSSRTGKEKTYFTTSEIYDRWEASIWDLYNFPQPNNILWASGRWWLEEAVHKAVESIMRVSPTIEKTSSQPQSPDRWTRKSSIGTVLTWIELSLPK